MTHMQDKHPDMYHHLAMEQCESNGHHQGRSGPRLEVQSELMYWILYSIHLFPSLITL